MKAELRRGQHTQLLFSSVMVEVGLSPLLRDSFSPLVNRKNSEVEKFASSQSYLEASAQTRCSRSKPVTVENCPKLVLNRSKLKTHCRSGVEPVARKRMWLDVVGVQDQDSVLLVKAFGEPSEGEHWQCMNCWFHTSPQLDQLCR